MTHVIFFDATTAKEHIVVDTSGAIVRTGSYQECAGWCISGGDPWFYAHNKHYQWDELTKKVVHFTPEGKEPVVLMDIGDLIKRYYESDPETDTYEDEMWGGEAMKDYQINRLILALVLLYIAHLNGCFT